MKPKSYEYRLSERLNFQLICRGFYSVLKGKGDELDIVNEFTEKHLAEIDNSFSNSEKASQLTALYFGMDKRQGRGILNKINARK